VAMSSSVFFSFVPSVFLVVRWLMLKKVPGVTTMWASFSWKPNLHEWLVAVDTVLLSLCRLL
jgi:hypothetical protein